MSRSLASTIALVTLVASCSTRATWNEPTITQQQALARIEQFIQETIEVIDPKPKLELYRPSLNVNSCLDPTDGGPENRIVVSRSYHMRDIPKDQLENVARQIKRHREQQGHYITGISQNGLNIAGRSRPDDFLFSLSSIGDNETLGLGASSPCIWPNGTPEPSVGT